MKRFYAPLPSPRGGKRVLTTLLLAVSLTAPLWAEPASEESLLDELWVQTSADYRAQCYQVYGWATATLRERLRLEQPPRNARGQLIYRTWLGGPHYQPVDRPLAVIMDLDETVIDNSAYQVFLARIGGHYTPASWSAFMTYQAEHAGASHAVPASVDFIKSAQEMGYTVLFVSNRTEADRANTLKVLGTIGLQAPDLNDRLLLDPGVEADARAARTVISALGLNPASPEADQLINAQGRKERRRMELRTRFLPVAYVGDDLGDFLSFVKDEKAPIPAVLEARYAAVERYRSQWGKEWFFLPNPMYGNWQPGMTLPRTGVDQYLHDDGFTESWRRSGH